MNCRSAPLLYTKLSTSRHFRKAKAMGGVADGLNLGVLLLVDDEVVNSFCDRDAHSSAGASTPFILVVDANEDPPEDVSGGYPGVFRVAVDALLSELYPKLCMGLSARDLWAMLTDGQEIWTGDEV